MNSDDFNPLGRIRSNRELLAGMRMLRALLSGDTAKPLPVSHIEARSKPDLVTRAERRRRTKARKAAHRQRQRNKKGR